MQTKPYEMLRGVNTVLRPPRSLELYWFKKSILLHKQITSRLQLNQDLLTHEIFIVLHNRLKSSQYPHDNDDMP